MIRQVGTDTELEKSAAVIRGAFSTVAAEFGITKENCPSHPAFMSADRLRIMKGHGVSLFGLFENSAQIGFVAVGKASGGLYFIEKLAVLPEHRRNGLGKRLMDYALDHVKQEGGNKLSIGIIDEHRVLKAWYADYGFVETGVRRFEHLPFAVCFMEKQIG